MILVTGAAGKTGQAIIHALHQAGQPVRALIYKASYTTTVQRIGARGVMVGDMMEPTILRQACQGVRAIYHICPNMHPHEFAIGKRVIEAAQNAGIQHLVYHSVLHPHIEAMPHHWQKMRVEEHLFTSGLPYTILQPAAYMQNIEPYWAEIRHSGFYRVPYGESTRLSAVDLFDVAQVAVKVLTKATYQRGIYELCSHDIWTPRHLAQHIQTVMGRPIQVEKIPLAQWQSQAQQSGLSAYAIESLLAMFRYYEAYGFCGNGFVLESLLARSPTNYATFLSRLSD